MKALFWAGANILVFASLFISVACAQPGSLDITFNPGTGADNAVLCMALQTNGQIVIAGGFTTFNGNPHIRIARLNTDGSVDGTFDVGGPDAQVNAIALHSNGTMVIGGLFASVNGVARSRVARLWYDGSLDTSFTPQSGNVRGMVLAVAVQPDGKVWIGGNSFFTGGTNRNNVARFNQNGTLDLDLPLKPGTFNVSALGIQSDGKLILGLQNLNAVGSYLERLNPDGTVDTNFLAVVEGAIGIEGVCSIVILPDDSFFIGGSFTSVNGYSRRGIARLNADGSTDTNFRPGSGVESTVRAVAVQTDGKVIVGGYFTSFNGITRNSIARLDAGGTLDGGFNAGAFGSLNTPYPVHSVLAQPDGRAVIGGSLTTINGTNINKVARLNGDTSTTNLQFMAANLYFGAYLSGTVSNTYRVEWTSNFGTPSLWKPLFNVTLQTNPQLIVDPNPPAGQRYYRAVELP